MNRNTVRNMWSPIPKIKFEELAFLVGFIATVCVYMYVIFTVMYARTCTCM